jgi:hypothetical protein
MHRAGCEVGLGAGRTRRTPETSAPPPYIPDPGGIPTLNWLTVEAHGSDQRPTRGLAAQRLPAQERPPHVQHGRLRGGGHRGLYQRPQRARHPARRGRQDGRERARAGGDRQHGDCCSNRPAGHRDDLPSAPRAAQACDVRATAEGESLRAGANWRGAASGAWLQAHAVGGEGAGQEVGRGGAGAGQGVGLRFALDTRAAEAKRAVPGRDRDALRKM